MDQAQTNTLTINQCMGTIMPLAQTTACLPLSLYTILQFLSVSIFEKTPISEAFSQEFNKIKTIECDNQLLLFDL